MKKITLVYFNILAVLSVICQPIFAQTPQIGDNFQGGIVFWLDGNGGGLIAAPSDLPTVAPQYGIGAQWGCSGIVISGADGTAIGTGNQNTIDIVAGCTTTGIAADICANLTLGGYSDWFLPSKDELYEMYLNLHQQGLGGFANSSYWSSTEYNANYAYFRDFSSGWQYYDVKIFLNYNVRAVRAFTSTPGCTDTTACNYDPNATQDDGSCNYGDIFGICGGNNTIQGAIDAATAGDVINIPAGTYPEALTIDKSISLLAASGVVLDVAGFGTGISVLVDVDGVVIDGISITGDTSTGSGITVQPGASNVTISNNTISGMLLPGGGNSSPLSYGILCWGNTTPVNPPTNINITNNSISNVLGSAISLGTNTANVTISGNSFSNIIAVALNATTYLAIGVQAELSDDLDIHNNSYNDLLQANNLVSCTNTTIGNNTYTNSPLMLNSTWPHLVSFNDAPWWNIIYPTSSTDFYQAYYSDTINSAYQGLVQTYAGMGAPIWNTLSSSNPGCTDSLACNYDPQALSDDGSCIYMGATPTQVNCWDVFTFNTSTCSWDTSGSQDPQPTLSCWETATFDSISCAWNVSGTQDPMPTLSCWETATFDSTSCSWVVSGTQVLAEISQSGETLSAMTNPPGLNADWYNIQNEDGNIRIWLMQEDASTFNPTFDCSYFIVVNHEGCTDTSEVYSYGASAARIGSFITSPNPTNGLVEVKFENNNNQFVTLKLIGNKGVILDEFITTEDNLKLDLSKYPSGNYYLHFNSEGAVQGCGLERVQKISTKIILNK